MRKIFYLMAMAIAAVTFTACSDQENLTTDMTGCDSAELTLNGNCDIYTLPNAENANWTITECPEWVTPVKESGTNANKIQLYVESNVITPVRKGSVTIKYANGVTHTTRVAQTNDASSFSLQRSYAAGWSFDIRTYNDIRGVRQQIFNTQKLKSDENSGFYITTATGVDIQFYYGEDLSKLQKDITAGLNVDVNYNAFSLNLNGSFGSHSLSSSKRIFSWVRYIQSSKAVSISADAEDAVEKGLFTADFMAMRKEVIDSKGSDEAISRLIEMYGTHYIGLALLGGCFDYYYSTELSKSLQKDTIEGAVKAGFDQKFKINIEGNADYKNLMDKLSSETVERFEVKGGDAVTLVRSIEDGSISDEAIKAWKETIDDVVDENGNVVTPGKYEVVYFDLLPIQSLFPTEECNKISDYLERMYYKELPLTRSKQ